MYIHYTDFQVTDGYKVKSGTTTATNISGTTFGWFNFLLLFVFIIFFKKMSHMQSQNHINVKEKLFY